MDIDYGEGSYVVYGEGPDGPRLGQLHDGYLSSGNGPKPGTWEFRVDGTEVYGVGGDLVGFIEDGVASRSTGQFLFRLEKD